MRISSFLRRVNRHGSNKIELANRDLSNSVTWGYLGLTFLGRCLTVRLDNDNDMAYIIDITEQDIKGLLEAVGHYKKLYPGSFPDIPTLDKKPTD